MPSTTCRRARVSQALEGSPFETYSDGTQTRCFCHVADAIRAFKGLMDEPTISGEIFNVGSANRISVLELAKRVVAATGSESSFSFVPLRRGLRGRDRGHAPSHPATDKVRAAIDWRMTRGLDDILAEVIDHMRIESVSLAESAAGG